VYQVVRDGKEQEVLAREVVPGDIIIVEEGQTIPADGKVRKYLFCPRTIS
jgi:H+-transporting ATPase